VGGVLAAWLLHRRKERSTAPATVG
jgi:hypothetical protein